MEEIKDIFIIGGGINGAGIAADAAGRGLSVVLCEKADLASGTSSASTKLIHGGLRYLEYYEFNLVRKALQEREILMRKAPHLITPLEFVLPYENHLRPAWLIRIGLFLYDHLAARKLIPKSQTIRFADDQRGDALKPSFKKGFSYYDCITDDSRLVVENAIAAKENGADILTRTEFISAQRENNTWKIILKNLANNAEIIYYAKSLINAAGPWVETVNQKIIGEKSFFSTQLVKGSHIVVPKLYHGNFAYILQNKDNRIVFTIPFQSHYTLIGTTDVLVNSSEKTGISDQEKNYLIDITNSYFKKTITSHDILWSYAGVRCLQNADSENPSATTRDYKILLATEKNILPLVTIIGGKITTFRDLAEDVLKKLKNFFPQMRPAWTAHKSLPGGDFIDHDFERFYQKFRKDYAWLPEDMALRYAKSYGIRVSLILENTHSLSDLGKEFGATLYQKEVDYLIQHEWAKTAEDILWRRTKLGLVVDEQTWQKLESYI